MPASSFVSGRTKLKLSTCEGKLSEVAPIGWTETGRT